MSTERSLAGRVRWAASLTATLVAAFVLTVSAVVVDTSVKNEAKRAVRSRGQVLIDEIDTELLEGEQLGQDEFASEVREFSHGGVFVTVHNPAGLVAGNPDVPPTELSGCRESSAQEDAWIVCRENSEQSSLWVIVGQPMETVLAHRKPLLFAGMLATVLVAIFGFIAGRLAERWALEPFNRFRAALKDLGTAQDVASWQVERTGLLELDEIVETLNTLLARLSRELGRARNFAGSAAHELRSPLARIKARLELVAERSEGVAGEQLSQQVVPAIDDLIMLVERLLMLALPGEALRGATLVSMASVAEESAESLPDEHSRRVVLDLEVDGHVVGDERVLRAMCVNAIGNALKFSEGPVRVALTLDGDGVVMTVRDEGPGLSEDLRERAFEPFFRAPEHRAGPGFGIGLALIAHIVEAHGGSARFLEVPSGAALQIVLPGHPIARSG